MNFLNLFKKKEVHTFDYLKNQKIVSIGQLPQPEENPSSIIESVLGIDFGNGCGLVVYNKCVYIGVQKLEDFINEKIINIIYSNIAVEFEFSGNKKLIVSLKPEDWNGPEAMQLNYNDQIYIWN